MLCYVVLLCVKRGEVGAKVIASERIAPYRKDVLVSACV
jgi:hypothetical protein